MRTARSSALIFLLSLASSAAAALDCQRFDYPHCTGPANQFAGGFAPADVAGGFGGGDCRAKRTPVVFIHGNGDSAIDWDAPTRSGAPSVYDTMKVGGYNDCELFGVTYLDADEREDPLGNYHRPAKYRQLIGFIREVKAYTGSAKIDIVAHSLGVSMGLATLHTHGAWSDVRRFVNIAGGIRGLESCLAVGFANPIAPTCGSENFFNPTVFGFYPYNNDWTGCCNERSLREMPSAHRGVRFFAIHAGAHDQIHCTPVPSTQDCTVGAEFVPAPNVRAQLDVGRGALPGEEPSGAPDNAAYQGGDANGVGHFRARIDSGQIIYRMLRTSCRGNGCLAR
jgi:pimeloyl-ACP methyl ester carboxylesterase